MIKEVECKELSDGKEVNNRFKKNIRDRILKYHNGELFFSYHNKSYKSFS